MPKGEGPLGHCRSPGCPCKRGSPGAALEGRVSGVSSAVQVPRSQGGCLGSPGFP